nr:hypothetical protein CFP56_27376 [Quercus suber]
MKEVKPRSCTKDTALASAIYGENVRLAYSDRKAIACPFLSRTITSILAFRISLNKAPSKFTLTVPIRGGDHLIQVGTLCQLYFGVPKTESWNVARASEAACITCDNGYSLDEVQT